MLDVNDDTEARRAASLGINGVPAVVVDGRLAECRNLARPNEKSLRAAGIGEPIVG